MLKLSFVGDIFPGNMPYNINKGIGNKISKNYSQYLQIKDLFNQSDFVIGNLESPLIDDIYHPNNKSFAGNNQFAKLLNDCGFSLVSVSNNHILEHGEQGFINTLNILESNNIKYIGKSINEKSNISVFSKNGIKICFAAFNDIPDIKIPNTYAELVERNILETIKEMEIHKPTYKILSFHWGNEYIHFPSQKQITLAHKFIDKGVDVIYGHHPHVIQPIEQYKNGLVFYSLGNFVFDMIYRKNVRTGIIINLKLDINRQMSYNIVPIEINNNFIPIATYDFSLINKIKEQYYFLYNHIYLQSPSNYNNIYNNNLKRKRLIQRLFMKKDLIKGLFIDFKGIKANILKRLSHFNSKVISNHV